jgi:hypothetical protein
MATYWLDRALWGPSPFFFHLTNLLLLAVCAALVAVAARRLTGDAVLAAGDGLLFAIHPTRRERRVDRRARRSALQHLPAPRAAGLRPMGREEAGIPSPRWSLFALGLLAKETAIVLVPLVVACCRARSVTPPGPTEIVARPAPRGAIVERPPVRPAASGARGTGPNADAGRARFVVQARLRVHGRRRRAADGEILRRAAAALRRLGGASVGSLVVFALAQGGGACRASCSPPAVVRGPARPVDHRFQERYLYLPGRRRRASASRPCDALSDAMAARA